jgi:hypothetical protein
MNSRTVAGEEVACAGHAYICGSGQRDDVDAEWRARLQPSGTAASVVRLQHWQRPA